MNNNMNTLDDVVSEVISLRRQGNPVHYSRIIRNNFHLMPKLADRLKQIQGVERAAKKVNCESNVEENLQTTFHDDIEFLRHSLPKYKIINNLYRGGQGAIYKAIQIATHREVVIKVLLDGPLATDRQRRRFSQEIELISKLQHPNIVTLYEAGVIRGREFYVMEYVDGHSIDDFILLNHYKLREIITLFTKVCDAVSAAHQIGIIHRDLKPSNIIVDQDGVPHVLDFGLAKYSSNLDTTEVNHLTLSGQIVGTLPYLSPEVVNSQSSPADVRSDVYSLAVVLFEIITGCYPYPVTGQTIDIIKTIIEHEPLSITKVLRHVDTYAKDKLRDINDDLERIIHKCLEKQPDQRYQSVGEFTKDLKHFLSGDPISIKANHLAYVSKKIILKYRKQFAILCILLMALMSTAVVTTISWRKAELLAKSYQSGLQAGSYNYLASIDRDAGRVNPAIEMLKSSISLSEFMDQQDPLVMRHVYDANHRLAELYLVLNRTEESIPYVQSTLHIAQSMVNQHPENNEWLRLMAFSLILQGKLYTNQGEIEFSITSFQYAINIYRKLSKTETPNTINLRDLSYSLGEISHCLIKLKQYDESYEAIQEAIQLRNSVISLDPSHINDEIEVIRLKCLLGYMYISIKTHSNDILAHDVLLDSKSCLERVRESSGSESRLRDINALQKNIDGNLALMERRLAQP